MNNEPLKLLVKNMTDSKLNGVYEASDEMVDYIIRTRVVVKDQPDSAKNGTYWANYKLMGGNNE